MLFHTFSYQYEYSHINTTTQGILALSTGLTTNKISVALMMTTTRICDSSISGVSLLHRNRKAVLTS